MNFDFSRLFKKNSIVSFLLYSLILNKLQIFRKDHLRFLFKTEEILKTHIVISIKQKELFILLKKKIFIFNYYYFTQ
jgi:hypothetical protein